MSDGKHVATWAVERMLIPPAFALTLLFAGIGMVDIMNPIGGAFLVVGAVILFAAIRIAISIGRTQSQLRVHAWFLFVDAIWLILGSAAVLLTESLSSLNLPVLVLLIVSVVVTSGDVTSLVIRTRRR